MLAVNFEHGHILTISIRPRLCNVPGSRRRRRRRRHSSSTSSSGSGTGGDSGSRNRSRSNGSNTGMNGNNPTITKRKNHVKVVLPRSVIEHNNDGCCRQGANSEAAVIQTKVSRASREEAAAKRTNLGLSA